MASLRQDREGSLRYQKTEGEAIFSTKSMVRFQVRTLNREILRGRGFLSSRHPVLWI